MQSPTSAQSLVQSFAAAALPFPGSETALARPGRTSVALSVVKEAHAAALGELQTINGKASTLIGWIAAIFAIALFQSLGTSAAPHSKLIGASFGCFVVSLCFAIFLLRARDIPHSGMMPPLEYYNYQADAYWDTVKIEGFTPDQIAEAQTQMYLIENTGKAIDNLRPVATEKQQLLRWAHAFFTLGIGLLALGLLFPHLLSR